MEPLASPQASRELGGGARGPRAAINDGALSIELPAGGRIADLRLWTQDGTAADQLIQMTEGVIVSEEREERELVVLPESLASGADGGSPVTAAVTESGREVSVSAEVRGPHHLVLTLAAESMPLRLGASWSMQPNEYLTGTGCRHAMRVDQVGRTIQLGADRRYTGPDCPPDMLEMGGVPMGDYVPVPWLVSNRGWAAWIECYGHGIELDLASDVSLSVRSAAGPLRLHLLCDPTPAALLRRYCSLTGFPEVLPEWGYGHWKSRDVHEHESAVLEDYEGYLEHDIPLDAIVIDSPWETQYNTWDFNPWQFPDPEGLIRRMRGTGVRTVVWCTPWINLESVDGQRPPDPESERTHREKASNYDEAAEAGHYIKQPDGRPYVAKWWMGTGSPIDFTSPEATDWWINQARKALALGVEGIKADDGEGYYFPDDLAFADGRTGADAAWAYPGLYRNAMQAALDAEHPGEGVLFARSGASGAQGPGHVWGGDQVSDYWSLQALVTATLTAAASGISNWSHDVGGYLGKTLVERCPADLFVRWTQFGCFTPLMQAHARFEQEAWRYGPEVLGIFREMVLLHERLVPYIMGAAATASRTGLPIIRPLPLVDPGDERGWTINDAYMFGPAMWVAPVLEEDAERRRAYLPRGSWIDFWTGARIEGGREVVVPAPLERIPVWVREGSILPTHPAESVADGLGESGVSTRPIEATLWGEPPTGTTKVRLADGTRIGWHRGRWQIGRPAGAPEREIEFACRGFRG